MFECFHGRKTLELLRETCTPVLPGQLMDCLTNRKIGPALGDGEFLRLGFVRSQPASNLRMKFRFGDLPSGLGIRYILRAQTQAGQPLRNENVPE
jgi:hypothetical protein